MMIARMLLLVFVVMTTPAQATLVSYQLALDAPLEGSTWPDTTPPGTPGGQSMAVVALQCDDVTGICSNTISVVNLLNPVELTPGVYYEPVVYNLFFNMVDDSFLSALDVVDLTIDGVATAFLPTKGANAIEVAQGGGSYYFDFLVSLGAPIAPGSTATIEFSLPANVLFATSAGTASPVYVAAGLVTQFPEDTGPTAVFIGAPFAPAQVPEPATLALLLIGALALPTVRRR